MSPRNLTREGIEELNDIEPNCFESDREEQWFNVGLQYGLDAADKEPNTEEPRLNQWFIAQIGEDAFDTFIMAMDRNQDWKSWCKDLNIKRWAHISDLLPKASTAKGV